MENYSEFISSTSNEVLNQLKEFLPGKSCHFKSGKDSVVTLVDRVSMQNSNVDFIVVINEKQYCIRYAFINKIITFDSDVSEKLNKIFEKAIEVDDAIVKQKRFEMEQNEIARQEKIALKEQEAKRKKLEAKIASQKDSAMKSALALSNFKLQSSCNLFVELGYIAKHAKHIYAAMPDYLEKWFLSEFGDVERRVVDTNHKTPSGLPPQFALSLKINLDTNDNMPVSLTRRLSSAKVATKAKAIADTSYVFTLCSKYGFKFGTEQNLNDILDTIPENMIDNFKLGYELA